MRVFGHGSLPPIAYSYVCGHLRTSYAVVATTPPRPPLCPPLDLEALHCPPPCLCVCAGRVCVARAKATHSGATAHLFSPLSGSVLRLVPHAIQPKGFPYKATMPKTRSGKQFADQLKTCQEMVEHGTEPRRQVWIGCTPTLLVSGTGALPAVNPPPLNDAATATAPPPETSEIITST